jgi:hypothetical protein
MDGNGGSSGFIAGAIGLYLQSKAEQDGPKPTVLGHGMRASGSGGCARQLAMAAAGVPDCHFPDEVSGLAMHQGNSGHEIAQQGLAHVLEDFEAEVPVTLTHLGFTVSGSADGAGTMGCKRHPSGQSRVVFEFKYKGAFGFKLGRENGPEQKEVVQAAIYALGLGIRRVFIGYFAREGSRMDRITLCESMEWTFYLDDLFGDTGQTLEQLAYDELHRMQAIWEQAKGNLIPARNIPGYGLVDAPVRYGAKKGQPWNCRYCRVRDYCAEMPAGQVPLSEAPVLVRESWLADYPEVVS